MRILTWNCNLSFGKKIRHIIELSPDIAVIQECEKELKNVPDGWKYQWIGNNPKKGLGVLSSIGNIEIDKSYDDRWTYFMPLNINNGKLKLLATWAFNHRAEKFGEDKTGMPREVISSLDNWIKDGDIIIAGDFNNSAIWDNKNSANNFRDIYTLLKENNITSAYHNHFNEELGNESNPTFFHTKKESSPFHIDYIFYSRTLNPELVNVGSYKDWIEYSDHVPIVADMDLSSQNNTVIRERRLLTATDIGRHFGISAIKVNRILSELGWIKKDGSGWVVTRLGESQSGIQSVEPTHRNKFVEWQDTIIHSQPLNESISVLCDDVSDDKTNKTKPNKKGFRAKFIAEHRAVDGHFVRSKAEMIIDNWLYMAGIPHAYERRLPIEEDVYTDFFIPYGSVYIEYWGYENNPKYLKRKEKKIEIYKRYNLNLIELEDKDIKNLDDVLPKLLLKYSINTIWRI